MLHNLSFDSHKLVYFIILSFSVFHKPCTQNTHLGRLKLKITIVIKPLSFPETQKILLQKDAHIWADTQQRRINYCNHVDLCDGHRYCTSNAGILSPDSLTLQYQVDLVTVLLVPSHLQGMTNCNFQNIKQVSLECLSPIFIQLSMWQNSCHP
jgi:hypothetical protein